MNVLVRELSKDDHAALLRQADARGQSLQQYLKAELHRLAHQPSLDDVLDRIGRREGGHVGLEQAVDDIAGERHRR